MPVGLSFPSQILSADSVRVDGVIDGDTIIISGGQRVRYLGIDAPEREGKGPAEFLAQESAQLNRRLVLKKEVRLVYGPERRDRYDRLLAYVFLENGLFVNGELVKQGLAKVLYHGPWMERFDELLQLQRGAIKDFRGIWAKALKESDDQLSGTSPYPEVSSSGLFFREKYCPQKSDYFPVKKRGLLARIQPLPYL